MARPPRSRVERFVVTPNENAFNRGMATSSTAFLNALSGRVLARRDRPDGIG